MSKAQPGWIIPAAGARAQTHAHGHTHTHARTHARAHAHAPAHKRNAPGKIPLDSATASAAGHTANVSVRAFARPQTFTAHFTATACVCPAGLRSLQSACTPAVPQPDKRKREQAKTAATRGVRSSAPQGPHQRLARGLKQNPGNLHDGTVLRCVATPICLCPFPRGEGDRHFPCWEGGERSSWSLTRQPAARSAAHFRTVVTPCRNPSTCVAQPARRFRQSECCNGMACTSRASHLRRRFPK